jgi:hypothetical protein
LEALIDHSVFYHVVNDFGQHQVYSLSSPVFEGSKALLGLLLQAVLLDGIVLSVLVN